MTATRRLVAIIAADIARLVGFDEEGTLVRLRELRRELIDPQIEAHHRRIVRTTADGILIEFASVVDAVRCAIAVQGDLALRRSGASSFKSLAMSESGPSRKKCAKQRTSGLKGKADSTATWRDSRV
jgi:adenylate cyclase